MSDNEEMVELSIQLKREWLALGLKAERLFREWFIADKQSDGAWERCLEVTKAIKEKR